MPAMWRNNELRAAPGLAAQPKRKPMQTKQMISISWAEVREAFIEKFKIPPDQFPPRPSGMHLNFGEWEDPESGLYWAVPTPKPASNELTQGEAEREGLIKPDPSQGFHNLP